jgi:hypothetical protein
VTVRVHEGHEGPETLHVTRGFGVLGELRTT